VLLLRAARWAKDTLGRSRTIEILTWLGWLLSVALFAIWTLHHYQPPAKPAWVGMTIRAFGFAAWMLVLREWLVIRLRFREHQSDKHTRDEE
jgi:hypothetical protein